MDDARAPATVVPLRGTSANDKPSERELVVRLLELIDSRERIEGSLSAAEAAVSEARTALTSTDAEIVSIKRALGASVRGRKGSRPTPAASSAGGSPRDRVKPRVDALMADGEQRVPREIIQALKITDPREKIAVRSLLPDYVKKGKYARKKVGKTNAGHPAYAYRSKS